MPSFLLDLDTAEKAVSFLVITIRSLAEQGVLKRDHYCIVVMDPTMTPEDSTFEEAILYTLSVNGDSWEHPYDRIAKSKAEITWRTGLPSHQVRETRPYLLKEGDACFFGSVNLEGVIVAVSGVEPWFDEMISTWVAATCRALSIGKMQRALADGVDFLESEE